MKIDKLTPEQEALLPAYRDKWLKIGLQSGKKLPAKDQLKFLFKGVYEAGGFVAPEIVITVTNPLEGCLASKYLSDMKAPFDLTDLQGQVDTYIAQNRDRKDVLKTLNNELNKAIYGLHDGFWLGFYDFFLEQFGMKEIEKLVPLMDLAKAGIGWSWCFEQAVVVSPQPAEFHMKNERLHNLTGPAIKYDNGFCVYAINGVIFEGEMIKFVTTPAKELNANEVLNIKNVEQRAETIKKVGINRLFTALNPEQLDTATVNGLPYQLYRVSIGYPVPRIYLKMNNPSIEGVHIEAVHPDCKTVMQALSYRNMGKVSDLFDPPVVLT